MLLAPREIQNSSILHGVDKTRIGPDRIGPDHGPDRGSDHGSDRIRSVIQSVIQSGPIQLLSTLHLADLDVQRCFEQKYWRVISVWVYIEQTLIPTTWNRLHQRFYKVLESAKILDLSKNDCSYSLICVLSLHVNNNIFILKYTNIITCMEWSCTGQVALNFYKALNW